MSEVLTKYQELTKEEIHPIKSEHYGRIRIRNRLEKFYPNEFIFVVPSKRDGTYIALNDIDHYIRFAIKKAQQDKEVISFLLNSIFYSNFRHQFYHLLSFLRHLKIINVKHVK
jgi:hypothetical protein